MPVETQDVLTVNGAAIAAPVRADDDRLDFSSRLDEFRAIQDGWLEGAGKAPNHRGLDWLANSARRHYRSADLPKPRIYPTPEGGVSLEWAIGPYRASVEIDLDAHEAEWHCLDLASGESYERDLHLDAPQDWEWLTSELRRLGDSTS